ncbi:MAG: T9SS type A sorting domain-containing protein [Bacteroidota bacterium]
MMYLKPLTLWLVAWLSMSTLLAQDAVDCNLSFHPVLEIVNQGPHNQHLGEVFFVLDKQRYDIQRGNIVFHSQKPSQLMLPMLEMEEGMHILEVYLADAQTNDLHEKGVMTRFSVFKDEPTHDFSQAEVMENDNPLTKDPSTCACQSDQSQHKPAATLWLYRIQDADNEPILLVSVDNGQNWTQAIAKTNGQTCPEFQLQGVNVAEVQASIVSQPQATPAFDLTFTATPNPFAETLHLQFPMIETGSASISVFNAGGQLVYRQSLTIDHVGPQSIAIAATDWAAGTYLILVQTPDQTWKEKVIHIR